METLLREALVRKTSHDSSTEHNRLLDTASIPVSVYEGNAGRRDAMDRLLDYAETMTVPDGKNGAKSFHHRGGNGNISLDFC